MVFGQNDDPPLTPPKRGISSITSMQNNTTVILSAKIIKNQHIAYARKKL